jgi:tetratricopeptide (TPR) repeat protein
VTYLHSAEATRDRRVVDGANRVLALHQISLTGAPAPGGPAGWALDPRAGMLAVAFGKVRPPSEAPPPFPFDRFAAFLIFSDITADRYLAVRAARRGVAASPRDPASYEALGEAYLHLLRDPLELTWSPGTPALRRLRLTQAAAAFWQALALDPTRATAHLGLGTIYLERQFLDLAVTEFRAAERFGRTPAQPDAEERTRALERAVESARRTTEANAPNLSALDKARLEARNGLTGQALDTLLQSDVSAFGAPGIALELDLLITVGRVQEAREWLAPEHRKEIGAGAHDWLSIQAAAALGDYPTAAAILLNQITASKPDSFISGAELWSALAVALKETFLKKQPLPRMALVLGLSILSQMADTGRQVALDYKGRSEGYLLLALLALEEGDIRTCDGYLNRLLAIRAEVESPGGPSSHYRTIAIQMRALIRR